MLWSPWISFSRCVRRSGCIVLPPRRDRPASIATKASRTNFPRAGIRSRTVGLGGASCITSQVSLSWLDLPACPSAGNRASGTRAACRGLSRSMAAVIRRSPSARTDIEEPAQQLSSKPMLLGSIIATRRSNSRPRPRRPARRPTDRWRLSV